MSRNSLESCMYFHQISKIYRQLLAITLGLLPLLIGCERNIYEPLIQLDQELTYIESGKKFMLKGHYSKAAIQFEIAKNINPMNSEARYFHAKAIMHGSSYNPIQVAIFLNRTFLNRQIPYLDLALDSLNALYHLNQEILSDISPIYAGETTGRFNQVDILVDYAIASTVLSVLQLRDTDLNSVINRLDYDLSFIINEQNQFLIQSLGNFNLHPHDFNLYIEEVDRLIQKSVSALGEIQLNQIRSGYNLMMIRSHLNNVQQGLNSYYMNDIIPNNPGIGDSDQSSVVNEECLVGKENDDDFLIDEDTTLLCA